MPIIETINLCQEIEGHVLLENINLSVERSEIFALIGPTGAGKTTLLRLLDLLDMPSSGKILFSGVDTALPREKRLELRRKMAFVLQKPVAFNQSVYDNVSNGLKWRGESNDSIVKKVNEALELTGLHDYQRRNARTLSGGETQRLAIARAITIKPELLIMDEPTANLDPNSALVIESLVSRVRQQLNTTIIIATHDFPQGQRLADRFGVMVDGKLQQVGSGSEIFYSPGNRRVAEFVGTENMIPGRISASEDGLVTVEASGKILEVVSDYPAGQEVLVCIRPEDITISLNALDCSARNCFACRISRLLPFGALTRVELECGFRMVALITRRSAEGMALSVGKEVYAIFKATAAYTLKKEPASD